MLVVIDNAKRNAPMGALLVIVRDIIGASNNTDNYTFNNNNSAPMDALLFVLRNMIGGFTVSIIVSLLVNVVVHIDVGIRRYR